MSVLREAIIVKSLKSAVCFMRGKITKHRFRKLIEVVAAVTPEIYVYKCLICGEVEWGNVPQKGEKP